MSIYSCNLLFCTWTMDMLCSDRISREFLKRSIWDQTIICDHCIRNHLLLNDRRWIKENFFCYGIVAHAAGITDHPVRQSSWGWGEIFLDTIVVCSVTALSLILTNSYIDYPNVTSAQLTTVAFKVAYGNIGGYFLSLAITVFAWTTIIGMYYSCAKSVNYVFGDSNANKIATPIYMVYYMLPCLLFYNIKADLLWAATDLLSAVYVIVTLIFIYSKRKEIMRLYNDFWDRFIPALKRGEYPEKVSYETVEEKGDVL